MSGTAGRERFAKVAFWMAKRASRNQGPMDRICRGVLGKLLKTEFQVDEMVSAEIAFEPDELARYEQGTSRLP
ncbi:MAG: hypothetical protein AB7Q81_14240 [Gammaproteobacteria bacterium]